MRVFGHMRQSDAGGDVLSRRWKRVWAIVAAGWLAAAAVADTTYSVRDLGTLGGPNSRAYGINEDGWVVGEAETGAGHLHAFLWSPTNGMADLGTLGGDISRAYSVNDRGQVVGEAEWEDGRMQAFLWTATAGITNLPMPEGFRESYAYDHNNFGVVVGAGDVGEGTRALVWTVDGPAVPPDLADAGSSIAYAVNDLGDVAGQAETGEPGSFLSRAFFLGHAGFFSNLGGLTGEFSSAALAVNEHGAAAGYAEQAEATHATRFSVTNGAADLDTLDNVYSVAYGINDQGDAVGLQVNSHEDEDRAFLYAGGRMVDLNEVIEADEPWLMVEARAINGAGQIAGYALLGEREHAVLLTPRANGDSPARPEVRVTEPVSGSRVSEGKDLDLAADVAASAGVRRVTFYANGVILGTATSAPYRLHWSAPPAGTYNLVAAAVDRRGRMRRSSRVVVRVMLGGAAGPEVAMIEPDDGTALAISNAILLRAEAGAREQDVVETGFWIEGSNIFSTAGSVAEFTWTPTTGGLFTLRAEALDAGGLRATSLPVRVNVSEP